MNNKEFVVELAQRMGVSQKEIVRLIGTFSVTLGDRLSESDSLSVYGFGSFEMVTRKERIVGVPVTGKRILVPPKRVVLFKPGVTLKDKVKNIDAE